MSDYLLVPTNVQAFVVGNPGDDPVYDLSPVPRTEDDVKNWYRDTKYSFSFQSSKLSQNGKPYSLEPGVHLHWALSAVLMHARHDGDKEPEQPYGDKEPEQPCIPNRWLVLRMWHATGDPNISSKGWVVESDFVSDDDKSGGTPFPFFGTDPPKVRYVGRAIPVKDWSETHPKYYFELKSFGWGDPSFAAYYPACKGILGFHDKLEDVEKDNHLTYFVIGWYSDPEKDPLHPGSGADTIEQYTERLASLGWSCSNLDAAMLPQRTLCHGGVVGVTWQGRDQKYPAASVGAPAKVAIGGSAAEALATLLAPDQQQKSLQQVLCAFQHGQATQVSDDYQLGELLHRHGFGAVPGGKLWSIAPVDRSLGAQPPLPPVSANVQALLGKLNDAQQALDRHARKIESLRWRLFACWATWASKQTGPHAGRPNRDLVDSVAKDLEAATTGLEDLENEVERWKNSATDALTAKKTGMPPFLHPKDPFVVLQGDNLVGVDRTRPQRPDASPEDALHCRLTKDVVTGVSLSDTVGKTWLATKCFTLVGFFDMAGTPPGEAIPTLALETLLFDPNCASLIVDTEELTLFKQLQESFDQSRKSDSSGNTLTWKGQPPDPLGITRRGRSNPWLPVYLMWQARWAPTYAPVQGSDNSHSGALDGWQLDSDPLAGDLVPQPNAAMQPKSDVPLLEGATIISTLSGSQLEENLRKFAEATGQVDHLNEVGQTLVLGQSLGGFNDLLLRQTLGLCLPPIDPTSKQVDTTVWEAIGRVPQPTMPVAGSFLPVRAGALKLVNLWIVDSFGQTRKLIDSASSSASQPTVITSAMLPKPPDGYHAGFSPRLVQPARLNFNWQPAENGTSGPVCGWIVANFLEKSFAVFSASGEPLGALERALPALGKKTIDSPVTFTWRPIPGSVLAIEEIDNQRLRRFVGLVTRFTADEGQAFLELVDLVLRRTDGRLPAEDPAMAVLLGRPLALVHASLGLEFQGLPAGYWKTADSTWTFATEGFEKLRVPVRLGGMNLPADGLVGYLSEDGEPCLFASEGAERRLGSNQKIKYDQDLKIACTDDPPVSLTLLMDAGARVHATTGILPRQSVMLPPEAARLAGRIEEVYFNVAPVLGERPRESASQPTMPRPSDAFGQWSWATRPDLTGKTQTWHEIKPADDRARFADDLALTEGWLRLRIKQGNATPDNETK